MRSLSVLVSTALLAVIAQAGPTRAQEAGYSDRDILAGRQKIRAELDTAKDNTGHISRIDQYNILLDAQKVLRPEDLEGLKRTLNRMASASEPIKVAQKVTFPDAAVPEPVGMPPGNPVVEPLGKPGAASPFTEESPEDISEPVVDDEMPYGHRRWLGRGMTMQDDGSDWGRKLNFDFASTVEGFKGPTDEGLNGNFGTGFDLNVGMGLFEHWASASRPAASISSATSTARRCPASATRISPPSGAFQRIPFKEGSLDYGFAYDWLFDNYYANYTLSQWRIKLAWELNPWNELGGWATIRDRGDSKLLAEFDDSTIALRPLDEGNFYWRHTWCNNVSLTGRLGFAQAPGAMILGLDGRVPISPRLALTSSFTYITQRGVPAGTANPGSQEYWNIAVGIEFVPGGFHP